jgi:hypothetical protein
LLTITENIILNLNYYELLRVNAFEYKESRHDIKHSENVEYDKLKPLMQKYHNYLKVNKQKKAIIITGRVHPGEVQSSYAIEGCVDFLLSSDPRA